MEQPLRRKKGIIPPNQTSSPCKWCNLGMVELTQCPHDANMYSHIQCSLPRCYCPSGWDSRMLHDPKILAIDFAKFTQSMVEIIHLYMSDCHVVPSTLINPSPTCPTMAFSSSHLNFIHELKKCGLV